MMTGMRAEEAGRFYEEDEDPEEVFAVFDHSEKGRTAPPAPTPSGPRTPVWADRLRHDVARVLRRAANIIDSPHARIR